MTLTTETCELPNLTYRQRWNGESLRLFLSNKDPNSLLEVEMRHWYGFSDEPDDYPAFVLQLREKGERGAGVDWWAIPLDQESTAMLANAFESMSKNLRGFAENWDKTYGDDDE